VNFHRNIRGGNSCDLTDRCGIHSFEIGEDHLPVNRLQPLDQPEEAFHCRTAVHAKLPLVADGCTFHVFQADESGVRPLLTDDVRSSNIVCHLIDPCPQRTALGKVFEAAPEGQVYLLEKVLAPVRVGFVGSSYPFQSRAVSVRGLGIKLIRVGIANRVVQLVPHIQGSRSPGEHLTEIFPEPPLGISV